MQGDRTDRDVRVRGEPAWEDPDCGRVAWFLEWLDRWGDRRRLLYGFGPGARHTAEAVADRIRTAEADEVRPCVVVAGPHAAEGAPAPEGEPW
jgi:hypothetical protein